MQKIGATLLINKSPVGALSISEDGADTAPTKRISLRLESRCSTLVHIEYSA